MYFPLSVIEKLFELLQVPHVSWNLVKVAIPSYADLLGRDGIVG